MTKLKVLGLAGESRRFVFSNLDVLRAHLKVILPAMVLFEAIKIYGVVTEQVWLQLLAVTPSTFLYAFFALSWHRSSLRGASVDHAIDFSATTKEEWGFIGLFFAIAFVPMFIFGFGGLIIGVIGHYAGSSVLTALVVIGIILGIIFMFYMMRVSFMLPARSVGVKLKIREAVKISKGALWPFMGAGMIFGLCFTIAFLVYTAVTLGTIYMVTGTVHFEGMNKAIMELLFSIPIIIGTFLMISMNITALSKAYQWGAQNNPV